MHQNLLHRFADFVRANPNIDVGKVGRDHPLLLDEIDVHGKAVRMVYAPFDYVNETARVVIVGMTPGAFQANNALAAAANALRQGRSVDQAVAEAKVFASFSGEPMRGNLVRMLDLIGVPKWLGISSAARTGWGSRISALATPQARYLNINVRRGPHSADLRRKFCQKF